MRGSFGSGLASRENWHEDWLRAEGCLQVFEATDNIFS